MRSKATLGLLLVVFLSCGSQKTEATSALQNSSTTKATSLQPKQGEAKGSFIYGADKIEFKYAFARKVKATYNDRGFVYALILSDQPFTEAIMKRLQTEDDFRRSLGIKNKIHFNINSAGEVISNNWDLSIQDVSQSGAGLFGKGDRQTVSVSDDSIEGELMEKSDIPGKWNYQVAFKVSITK